MDYSHEMHGFTLRRMRSRLDQLRSPAHSYPVGYQLTLEENERFFFVPELLRTAARAKDKVAADANAAEIIRYLAHRGWPLDSEYHTLNLPVCLPLQIAIHLGLPQSTRSLIVAGVPLEYSENQGLAQRCHWGDTFALGSGMDLVRFAMGGKEGAISARHLLAAGACASPEERFQLGKWIVESGELDLRRISRDVLDTVGAPLWEDLEVTSQLDCQSLGNSWFDGLFGRHPTGVLSLPKTVAILARTLSSQQKKDFDQRMTNLRGLLGLPLPSSQIQCWHEAVLATVPMSEESDISEFPRL